MASFLFLFGCEKQPVVIKEVICYDCYREYIEVRETVTMYNIVVSSDTMKKTNQFIMTVCLAPEDMSQIQLYEGTSSIIFVGVPTQPNLLGWDKKIERIRCK